MFIVMYMHVGIDMIVWAVKRYAGAVLYKES